MKYNAINVHITMFVCRNGRRETRSPQPWGGRQRHLQAICCTPWVKNLHTMSREEPKKLFTLFTLFFCLLPAGADKKAEAGAGAATEFQFVSIDFCF